MTFASAITEVLSLQTQYSWQQTQEMLRRRELVEGDLKGQFSEVVSRITGGPRYVVDASSGIGNPAKVPWVRISDKAQSPSAQRGWYVVLLVSADGQAAYLSLDMGVTRLSKEEVELKRNEGLRLLGEDFPQGLSDAQSTRFRREIRLSDPNLGKRYEQGNVGAFEYSASTLPTDTELEDDIRWLLQELAKLPRVEEEMEKMELIDGDDPELDALAASTGLDVSILRDMIESLLDASPQIVLTGPPGTGKTHVAQELAVFLTRGQERDGATSPVRILQFHPNYGYEDFVEGLRPAPGENGALLEFAPEPGVLIRLVDEMVHYPDDFYVLIVDEMNRANLPRVFGELLFLLEYRDAAIDLQYRQGFKLPKKLLFIGTMNTADRSAAAIDIALRRRFDFFELAPSVEVLRNFYSRSENVNEIEDALFDGFEALNVNLEQRLGDRNFQVGHTYFMETNMTSSRLNKIWRQQIKPLIEDYFFDQPDIAKEFAFHTFWPNV